MNKPTKNEGSIEQKNKWKNIQMNQPNNQSKIQPTKKEGRNEGFFTGPSGGTLQQNVSLFRKNSNLEHY